VGGKGITAGYRPRVVEADAKKTTGGQNKRTQRTLPLKDTIGSYCRRTREFQIWWLKIHISRGPRFRRMHQYPRISAARRGVGCVLSAPCLEPPESFFQPGANVISTRSNSNTKCGGR